MKEQTKEKIAFLVMLLFCLAYLIPWSYDKVIRQPKEATEKEKSEQRLRFIEEENDRVTEWWFEIASATATTISAEELESLNSDSNVLTLGSEITVGEILILPEEGAEHEGQILTIDDSGFIIFEESPPHHLAWESLGYDLLGRSAITMFSEDYKKIETIVDFINWLYENDYEIVKKK